MTMTVLDRAPVAGDAGRVTGEQERPDPEVPERARRRMFAAQYKPAPAACLTTWCRLLGLYDCDDLKNAEPGTLCYRLPSLPPGSSATPAPAC